MNAFRILRTITSVETWHKYAPPKKKDKHWKEGRSAMELAKAWFPDDSNKPTIPVELTGLLESCSLTEGLTFREAWPEYETKLDTYGEGRNADLIILADSANGKFLISIEAKADEKFGDQIIKRLKDVKNNPASKVPRRIDLLTKAIFGTTIGESRWIGNLYYQLLHAVVGTLIEAKKQKADYAIFIVHEFRSCSCQKDKLDINEQALSEFVGRLDLDSKGSKNYDGRLAGPFKVVGNEFVPNDIPLFIGKIRRDLRSKKPLIH